MASPLMANKQTDALSPAIEAIIARGVADLSPKFGEQVEALLRLIAVSAVEAVSALPPTPASAPVSEAHPDTRRLNWILRKAVLSSSEDGESLYLFLGLHDEERAIATVAEASGEDIEEFFTAADAPFLTDEQRGHINGSIPHAKGYVDDPATIRAAIDAALQATPTETDDAR